MRSKNLIKRQETSLCKCNNMVFHFHMNAIGFYLHEGFELIGFDTCCYTNNDMKRREVRINLGYFFHKEEQRW